MNKYIYIDSSNFPKFESALESYKAWHELNEYLDENHPMRMDDYSEILRKRINLKNVVYRLLDLGFVEVDSNEAVCNDLIPLELDEQVYSLSNHATIYILDEKKWGYFKIKAEL